MSATGPSGSSDDGARSGALGDQGRAGEGRRLVVVGNFDGVHRGHQAVLEDAARDARALGLEPVVLTFDPHPATVLGRTAPPLLSTIERKRELVRRVDPSIDMVVERFDTQFASLLPAEFAERVLVGKLGGRVVEVGHNFRFGRGAKGDHAELERLGRALGFDVRSHELVGDERGGFSSTRARAAIAAGDLREAERVLGRPHMLSGVVTAGERRGRTIGFPTCNLVGVPEALPPFGVYAVLVDRRVGAKAGETGRFSVLSRGVANLGVRPTVHAGGRPVLEVHLFDVDEDLYGVELRVHLIEWLRPERKFSGLAELREQIAKDAEAARRRLETEVPREGAGSAWA